MNRKILVVDDDDMVRRTVCDVLEIAGFAVAEAANGREAVEHLETAPADVVITDILMPVQEGIETIAILRRRHPGLKILAISGGGRTGKEAHFLDAARRMGADGILAKPFLPRQLLDAVNGLLAPPAN